MEDPEPVEDRCGVDQRSEDRHGADPGTGEAVVEAHRLLLDPIEAERARDGEQLEVEGVALDQEERDHLLGDLPPEELQPDLGVADVEAEEEPDELLVEPARGAPRSRIVDARAGMALGADREVEVVAARRREERRNRAGVEVEVGVDVGDPAAPWRRARRP